MWPFKKKSYQGASLASRLADWVLSGNDSARENSGLAISTLRNRARDLYRNSEVARNGVSLMTAKLISKHGLQPRFKLSPQTKISNRDIVKMRENPRLPEGVQSILRAPSITADRKFEMVIEELWRIFNTQCDYSGNRTYDYLTRVAISSMILSGESLILRRRTKDIIPFRLQLLEADHINSDVDNFQDVFQGVKIDTKTGRPTHLMLYDNHPGSLSFSANTSERSLNDIVHIMDQDRPGQLRGVSWLSPVIVTIRELGKAQGNELMRQAIASCFAAFVTGADKTLDPGYVAGSGTGDEEVLATSRIEPGAIYHLPDGAAVQLGSPPSNLGYSDFSRINLQRIASGFGISYSALSGDFSNVNFSSARMAETVAFERLSPIRQHVLAEGMTVKIANWFLDAIQLIGIPKIPIRVVVPPMIQSSVDPEKEIKVIEKELGLGIISYSEAIRRSGRDPDIVRKEILEDQEFFRDNNISLNIYGLGGTGAPPDEPIPPDKEDIEEEDT